MIRTATLLLALAAAGLSPEPHPTGPPCRWEKRTVTVCQRLAIQGIPPEECARIVAESCADWSKACGIDLRIVEGWESLEADILIVAAPIDGPRALVGYAAFPCRSTRPTILIDTNETWTPSSLKGTVLHELGHSIGIQHAPLKTPSVMAPYVNSFRVPQPWDTREARKRYGPAPTAPKTMGASR